MLSGQERTRDWREEYLRRQRRHPDRTVGADGIADPQPRRIVLAEPEVEHDNMELGLPKIAGWPKSDRNG